MAPILTIFAVLNPEGIRHFVSVISSDLPSNPVRQMALSY